MGFVFGEKTYLRDTWNWLDFFVVIASLLSILPSFDNVSGIRALRLMRPLRTLTNLGSMKVLIGTLISSVSQLGEIIIFSFFFFLIFAILGVSLWAGKLDYRWRTTPEPVNGDWIAVSTDLDNWGAREWSINTYWGSLVDQHDNHPGTITVSDLYRDTKIEHLNWGITNFDDILYAFL